MLQIKIENSYFDIPNDIQVPVSVLNPMVSDSGFNEIFTYSFNLQASPKNKAIYLKYVNTNARISLSFQSHLLATGVAKMKMDSNGISVMIKNDGLDLRQQLENTTFDALDLPTISICDAEDLPTVKIAKWNAYMNSKLPENEPWNEGAFKFTPIYAAPTIEWAINEDTSGYDINPTMWENGFPINAYSLVDGEYIANYGIDLPQKASFKILLPAASFISGGQYFIFNAAENVNKYYCWFTINGAGTDPTPSGRTGIKVELLSTDDQPTTCTKCLQKIAILVNDFEVNDFGDGTGTITNVKGALTDSPANINVHLMLITDIDNGSGTIDQAKNNWRTTVSPTIRIDYLLKQICKYFTLISKNEYLESIPEYQALVTYSGKVMDMREDDESYQYNVSGLEIDLNEFKPKTALIQIFNILRHFFGVHFFYTSGKLLIQKIDLSIKPFNISKFCQPQFLINELENKAITYTYNLGDAFWKYGDFYIAPGITGKYLNYFQSKTIGIGTTTEEETPFQMLVDSNSVPTSFKWPELAKSNVYNPNDYTATDKFILGCFRGNFEISWWSRLDGFADTNEGSGIRMICFNQNSILENETPIFGEKVDFVGEFGTASMYLNNDDSYLTSYAKFFNQLKLYNQEIEKNLNLPFQKIIEIMRWKQPIHAIQQRNMSFRGIVKELKFTLGKSTISPATITYLVNKNTSTGDFNTDFNDDFNS